MKEKMNQMFRDKLFLVMLVLGLLTMVAAAGVVTIRRGSGQEQKPYVDMQGQDEYFAEEAKDQAPVAGNSNAENSGSEITQEEQILAEAASNQDNAADEQGHIAEEAGPETGNGQNTGLAANGTKDDGADPAVREAGAGGSAATALVLNFADTSKMLWPSDLLQEAMSCWITAWIPPSIFRPWNSTNAIRAWSSRGRSAPRCMLRLPQGYWKQETMRRLVIIWSWTLAMITQSPAAS